MKKLRINASNSYDIIVEDNILSKVGEYLNGEYIKGIKAKKIMIVSDSRVFPLYGKSVTDSLIKEGFKVYNHVFTQGEKNKNLATVEDIFNSLAKNEFTRTDLIVALGGGVVGDTAGFTASAYLRGIKFIQLPTTLLADIDSSVGGKTGVDIPAGKNLVGAFYQPSLVLIDPLALTTLDEKIYSAGMAEAIKYGIICDSKLFDNIKNKKIDNESLIYECVKIKGNIVEEDEFDLGKRQLLNLGHTFGHAVEKLSEFKLSHGEAISIGMVMASEFSYKIGFGKDITEEIKEILNIYSLPIYSEYRKEDIYKVLLIDKKRRGDEISLILPKDIGTTEIYKIKIEKFKELFV